MSILKVDQMQTRTGAGTIVIPTGNKIVGTDVGSVYSPGNVIQVVQGVLPDPVVYSAVSWGDIGLSVTITPKFATSKILVRATVQVGGNASSYDSGLALLRNGVHIALPNNYGSKMACFMPLNHRGMSQYETSTVSGEYLDSPATISAIVYKIQAYANSGTQQFINRTASDADMYQDSRHISTITVMEIAQ